MFTKYILAEKSEIVDTDSEKSVVGWGSKPQPDRDGELIEASAWDLDNYRKNPVLCLSHDLTKPPIGKILWVKADPNGLKFKAQFANTERGKEAYQLYKDGMMTSFSVGFRPKKDGFIDNPQDEQYKGMNLKRLFRSVELFEISCVTVPSLPSAVVECVKSGKIKDLTFKAELEEMIEKKEAEEKHVGVVTLDTKDLEDLNSALQEMKKKIDKLEAKEKALEEESKTLDFISKQPSVYDIINSLSGAFSNKETALPSAVEVGMDRPYVYVVDLYPTTYPDGFAIFRVSFYSGGVNTTKTFRQGYTYDAITKKSTLVDEAVAVEEAWVEKKYAPEKLAEMDENMGGEDETNIGENIHSKRAMIEEHMSHLTEHIDFLQSLLDVEEEGKDVDDEDEGEVDDIEIDGLDVEDGDTHVKDDEIPIEDEGTVEDDGELDELDISEKELTDIIAKTVGTATKELNSMVKESAVEEANKLMGKATISK